MASNYDNSAWFYDFLSRIVYGKEIIRSQIYLLPHIPSGATILIAGGGTGWVLEEIAKIHTSGLKITYAEVSAKMMAISRKRNVAHNQVTYINDAIENITFSDQFDIVFTPFLFDNFTEQTLHHVFDHIHQSLKPMGIWLNTDFHLTGKWWQSFMLSSMILFFRIICRIEASRLPDVQKCFEKHGYSIIDEQLFFKDFILSRGYKKVKN